MFRSQTNVAPTRAISCPSSGTVSPFAVELMLMGMIECVFGQASTPMLDMFVVDLMHMVELGIWKAVFIHMLRLLDCHLKYELDRWQVSINLLWACTDSDSSIRFREILPLGLMVSGGEQRTDPN